MKMLGPAADRYEVDALAFGVRDHMSDQPFTNIACEIGFSVAGCKHKVDPDPDI